MTRTATRPSPGFTLTHALVNAVARLVDDHEAPRQPSHWDIEQILNQSGLADADPNADPRTRVGKRKRLQHVLSWALENDVVAGAEAVDRLIGLIRGSGGFRAENPNYCGAETIATCRESFHDQPVELTVDGVLRPRSLDSLSGRDLTVALRSYVLRAQNGHADSVLLAGTGKDLLEATAAHVLTERFGTYSSGLNFPTLLGQAFYAVGLDAQPPKQEQGGIAGARASFSVSLYETGCAINRLRNKAGSGHGRPFLPDLSPGEVRSATEAAGLVAGRLLDALEESS